MNVVDASLYVLAGITLHVLAVVVSVLLVDDRMGEIIPRLSRAVPCLTRFYRDRSRGVAA